MQTKKIKIPYYANGHYRYNINHTIIGQGRFFPFFMRFHHIAEAATLTLILAAPVAQAQEGTTAYQSLNVPSSAHVYALGGHNISLIDDDINLVEQNPALLGPEFDHQVGLNYMRYMGSTNFMGARYGQGIDEHSAFGVGVQYFGYGSFDRAETDGTRDGTFSAYDLALSVTYTRDIVTNLRGGITLKYMSSKYDEYSAGAIAADIGVNYYNPDNDLSLSLVAKNLGGQVKKFGDTRDDLPWDIQLGYSQMLRNAPVRLSVTACNLRHWHLPYYVPEDKNNSQSDLVEKDSFGSNLMRHLVFGVEVVPRDNMWIGLGYNYKVRTDMSTYQRNFLSGFSIGAGLKVRALGFSFAFAQPHSSASTFMLNLTTSIGELLK